MSSLRRACRYAVSDRIPLRSFYVATVVGTILNVINQGDALFGSGSINWIKITLTYFVPYALDIRTTTVRAMILKSETYNFHRLDLTRQGGFIVTVYDEDGLRPRQPRYARPLIRPSQRAARS